MKIILFIALLLTISGCQKIESLLSGKIYLSCNGSVTTYQSQTSTNYLEEWKDEWTNQATISVVISRKNMKINDRRSRFLDTLKICSNNEMIKFDSDDCEDLLTIYSRLINDNNYSKEQADLVAKYAPRTFGTYDKITKRIMLTYIHDYKSGLKDASSGEFLCKEVNI